MRANASKLASAWSRAGAHIKSVLEVFCHLIINIKKTRPEWLQQILWPFNQLLCRNKKYFTLKLLQLKPAAHYSNLDCFKPLNRETEVRERNSPSNCALPPVGETKNETWYYFLFWTANLKSHHTCHHSENHFKKTFQNKLLEKWFKV